MKLMIIRHGDPDYSIDSLTEKGWREAEYLADRLVKLDVREFFVSPLGRAKDTASITLKRLGRTAEECLWLREFQAPIFRPDHSEEKICPWDWLPQDWTREERFYQYDRWAEPEMMTEGFVGAQYGWVSFSLDQLLARFGYVRDGHVYRVEDPNNDTLVFFCHFGVECVLLSHLLGISPMPLWHGFCAAPSSVTTVVTEERRKGIASFRVLSFGDISHLYAQGEGPAFAARFREAYGNEWERKD